MAVTIDKFEYATDLAAQNAYTSNIYGSNLATGGSASASSVYGAQVASNAFDGNDATWWEAYPVSPPQWLKYDFGAGNEKIVNSFSMTTFHVTYYYSSYIFQGSNNDIDWVDLKTKTGGIYTTDKIDFNNNTAYRYYRLYMNGYSPANNPTMRTMQFFYRTVPFSEGTIIKVGTYSMKTVFPITISLNKTLTRTVSPTINLTDQDNLKIWIRASRTGTNFKLGLHDSGGTTTESNIAISSADTWEEKEIDISAVANANKDAIDLITITVTNADAENTIYLDEMLAYVTDEGTGSGGGITNAINVSILTPSGWQKGI